ASPWDICADTPRCSGNIITPFAASAFISCAKDLFCAAASVTVSLTKGIAMMLDSTHNLPRGTICIEDLEIGMTRSLTKEITDRDIELFAEVSTDRNPVHLDDAYAQDTIFEGRIAHGMLTAGLISAVIGEQLPGHGTVYLGQSLKFM